MAGFHARATGSGGPIQAGVSLIEFLVVLVVITIGLLSVAGMLAYGIRHDYETSLRTIAASRAKSLAERIHTNPLGASRGFYDPSRGNDCAAAFPNSETNLLRCNSAYTLAVADRSNWVASNATTLPNGAGTVSFNNGLYTIAISWRENERPVGGTTTTAPTRTLSFVYQSIPEIYVP